MANVCISKDEKIKQKDDASLEYYEENDGYEDEEEESDDREEGMEEGVEVEAVVLVFPAAGPALE